MPFPWKKKNRVTRISQIVADLQSPKRGGSLVVETGFPTSLIDLFVKNRSRFKKPKFKKPVHHPEIPDPPPPPPSPATTPPLPEPPSPTGPRAEPPSLSRLAGENVDGVAVSGRVGECGGGSDANMVVVVGVLVKMLVVVGLIASVKKLTVGITVSAFALLFLESAGKRVVSCLGPCSNVAVESLAQRVSACVWYQKLLQLKVKKDCELNPDSLSIDEIEVVETNSTRVGICYEETYFAEPQLELVEIDSNSKGNFVEPCCEEVSECKTRGSRSGRFKSMMVKKLVPKKFRGSKKEKKESSEEDRLISFEIEEEQGVGKEEEEENKNRNRSQLMLLETKLDCRRGDDEVDCGITSSQDSALAREERIDRVGNSGYAILLVIAFAGLLVGRLPALILTMTWCFMLKIVKTLWRS